jgi:hypothetical protein
MVTIASITLVTLSPLETDKVPLANEKVPPIKSNIILNIDQPLVLFLL